MLNSVTAKIKSAPRSQARTIFFAAILLAVVASGVAFILLNQNPTLQVGNRRYELMVADTPELRAHGLSNTVSLPNDQAMIFVFPNSTKSCFWMKDMNYSLDMVWLDTDKHIVHIQRNATPDSYPDTTFCTPRAAKYVLEVNAGEALRSGMHVGQQLAF